MFDENRIYQRLFGIYFACNAIKQSIMNKPKLVLNKRRVIWGIAIGIALALVLGYFLFPILIV